MGQRLFWLRLSQRASLSEQIFQIVSPGISRGVGRVLEVYSIHLPLDSPTVCDNSFDMIYSFVLNEGLFHKVSLHGDHIASSILDHVFPGGGQSSQVLVANWKTGQQITISPRFTDVRIPDQRWRLNPG